MKKRAMRKCRLGEVVSDKMRSTVVVEIVRRAKHSRFKKYFDKRSRFYAHHDEKLDAKVGDIVKIRECAPLSKLKRWKVVEVVKKGLTGTV